MLQSVSIFSLKRYIFVFLPHTATHSQPSHSYTQQAITQLHTASHRNIYTLVPHHTATAQNCEPARKPRRRRKIEIFVSKIASKNNHFVTNYCPFGQLCWTRDKLQCQVNLYVFNVQLKIDVQSRYSSYSLKCFNLIRLDLISFYLFLCVLICFNLF